MRILAALAIVLLAGCTPPPPPVTQPSPPSTPPPIPPPPPSRPLLQAVIFGHVREPVGNRPAAHALITAVECGGAPVASPAAQRFADERGNYEITAEAGVGPDVVKCLAVSAQHHGSANEVVLPNVHFRTAQPPERYRADIDLPPVAPLTLAEAETLIDAFVAHLNHGAEAHLSTLVGGGPEALRTAREDYQSLLGNHITATIRSSEFQPTHQNVTAELRGDRGGGISISVYQDDGLRRLQSPLLLYSLRSRMMMAMFSRLISAGEAERLARLLTPDDVDFPLEEARKLIERHRPRFEVRGGAYEMIAVDERLNTLTYRLTFRGEKDEKAIEVVLRYGDGLLGLVEVRDPR